MKSQLKKIISIFACICLLLSAMVITATAAETSATISFADTANRTSLSTTQQVWEQNGIKVTGNKSNSTNDVKDYSNPARFYKGSSVTVEYPGMTKLVIEAVSSYAAWDTSFTDANASATADGTTITIVFATAVDSFTFSEMSAQCRAKTMTVYSGADEGGNEGGDGEGDNTPAFDPTGKTAAEIVEAAYELTGSETIDNVSITGEITTINDPYSSSYHNITVTLAVEGTEKTMYCYRLTAAEADWETLAGLAVGDTVTVEGNIVVYNNAPQFAAGTMMTACVKGEGEAPVAPEDPKEIVDAAFALEVNAALPYEVTLTGEVVSIDEAYSEQFGNITITMAVEGSDGTKDLVCYRLKAAEGEDASTLAVGDVITVTGNIKNYGGTVEFISGCTYVTATVDDGNDAPATDGDNTGDNTDNDNTTGGTTTGGTTTGGTTTDKDNTNTDNSDKSPSTGDNAGAFAVMVIAAAAVLVASKKRA